MDEHQAVSYLSALAVLAAVASAGFYCVWTISRRLRSVKACYMLAAMLFAASLACLWFIDINFPLSGSNFRSGGQPAPLWVGGFAWFVRSAAFAAIVIAASRHRKESHPEPGG
jgi:hypothetical protein